MQLKDVWLKVVGGDAKAADIKLKLPTIIGRSKQATLTLPHPLVSRNHCEIFEREGKLWVRDLASLNGTFVDNVKLVGESVLEPTQLLTVGAVTFRAIYGDDLNGDLDQLQNHRDESTFAKPTDSTVRAPQSQAIDQTELAVNSIADTDQQIPLKSPLSVPHSKNGSRSQTTPNDRNGRGSSLNKLESGKQVAAFQPSRKLQVAVRVLEEYGEVNPATENGPSESNKVSPEHSIIAALNTIEGLVSAPEVSFSGLSELVTDDHATVNVVVSASDIHIDADNAPRAGVGESFLAVLNDEPDREALSPNDSSLNSFIKKLPR
ncbi:MAG TPA: FHA domain-containing protein [Pirellulaceae bacterium]|nr:FHA domain-containing protein [Pirellulaceae bacterium]HMO93096.1 FHA domain-containing protein [Pirellulaceae bacterium]HMP69953.1 FHA domain-containing protein [Pirellulaceae bacterium]